MNPFIVAHEIEEDFLRSGGAAEVPSRNEGDRSGAAGFLAHPERRREVGALPLLQQAAGLGFWSELVFGRASRPRTPIHAFAQVRGG